MSYHYDRRQKTAADEVLREGLPADRQQFIMLLERKLGWKATTFWDGIHGYIAEFDTRSHMSRLMKDDLKLLMGNPLFRWVSLSLKGSSVGM